MIITESIPLILRQSKWLNVKRGSMTQYRSHQIRRRYYDPALGRFIQRDPSGKDLSHTYTGANPVNSVDPDGLSTQTVSGEGCYYVCLSVGWPWEDEGIPAWLWASVEEPASREATRKAPGQ